VSEPKKKDDSELGGWDAFLHEHVRSAELRRLPGGARTVLSGGAAGQWYFEWFNSCYSTPVERHIAVEAFAPKPRDLPPEVEWLSRTLGDLGPVADEQVDLVFGGEVLEHLWPDDVVGFLLEAHRVLRVGGTIALDSPNRRVTMATDWLHPEHTVEFTADEAFELLTAAGFAKLEIRGAWLTYDRESHCFLPLDQVDAAGSWPWRRRLDEAVQHPEDSFIWWALGGKTAGAAAQDPERLRQIVSRAFSTYRAFRLSRLRNEIGRLETFGDTPVVRTELGEPGLLVAGPNVPMPPGAATAQFQLAARGSNGHGDGVATLEVTSENGSRLVASRCVNNSELPHDGSFAKVDLPFQLATTAFGVEFRVVSTGQPDVAVDALLAVEVDRPDASPVKMGPASMNDLTDKVPARREGPEDPSKDLVAVPEERKAAATVGRSPVGRRLARFLLWPVMRFFDPRFQGIATQISVSHDDLAEMISEVSANAAGETQVLGERLAKELEQLRASVAEVDRLARSEIEMAADATTLIGEALGDVSRVGQETRELVRKLPDDAITAYIRRLSEREVDQLDPAVEQLLNFAESHKGFAAQRNLWFNSPVSVSYEDRNVAIGAVNERIVELPYVLRALAAIAPGAEVLDIGATESLLSLHLASLGYNVTALDPRPYPLEHPRLEVVAAEVQRWEPKKEFDAVVCLSTIEHIGLGAYGDAQDDGRADLEAMNRIRAWTRSGGLLLLTTPFGAAESDAFTRIYDRAGIDELLVGWKVTDLTIARRESDSTWVIDREARVEPGAQAVALVTATTSET
jgi:2-polyprenyl-3-methyl-5-hydroxy-6-metoxy-1,4-benzoquinol methylase